jgi:hypothetical protein
MVDGFLSDGWMPQRPAATTTSAQRSVQWELAYSVDAPLSVGFLELAFVL